MHVDELGAVHAIVGYTRRGISAVDRADGHHRDPAQRAGMHVADGPFGVMRQR